MKLTHTFLAVTAILAPAAVASTTTCPTGSLSAYTVSGFTCTSGNLLFSNFTYGGSANPSGLTIPASGVAVTPQTTTGNEGFQFSSGWIVATGTGNINDFQDSLIDFTVSTVNHTNSLNGLTLFFNGAFTVTGVSSVVENFCPGGPLATCAHTGQIKVTNPPTSFSNQVFFSGVNTLEVSKDISVASGTNGSAAISQVINTYQQGGVPEPMSYLLLGSGLLGLGLLRKRTQQS